MSGKSPTSWLGGIAQSLFATVFPSDCRLCGCFLANISNLPVCDECLSAITPMAGSFCVICGEWLTRAEEMSFEKIEGICAICRKLRPPFATAAAYGSYDHGLRELVHLLKYEKVRPATKVLGRMLAQVIEKLEPAFETKTILVVPVPLHSAKRRQRGFNQAQVIARAALRCLRTTKRFNLNTRVLQRQRVTESQIGLSQHQRRENLRGAFKVLKPAGMVETEVLLVDDVFTTGTTVSECARTLLRAGFQRVCVATVARTLKTNIHGAEEFENSQVAMAG